MATEVRMAVRCLLFVLTAVLGLSGRSSAQSLMVTPKRLVFDDKHRTDVVKLYNNSDDTMSYSVKWKHFRMQEDGQYIEIDTVADSDRIADSFIRYFPPEVTLPPHSAQVVRLRFLKPSDLAPGEYRSHLAFTGIERSRPIEQQDTADNKVRVRFNPIWGVSIPIIARNQTSAPIVTIDSVSFGMVDSGKRALVHANLNRTGGESSYGSIVVRYLNAAGEKKHLYLIKNVAVFPPLTTRKLGLLFPVPEGLNPASGKIVVDYQTATGQAEEQVLASAECEIGR
jgi:hypothetical protein